MRKFMSLTLALILSLTILIRLGCTAASAAALDLTDADGFQTINVSESATQLVPETDGLPGLYGEQMGRSRNYSFPYDVFDTVPKNEDQRCNGYTYPYVFNDPIRKCEGFTLNYEITEVHQGDLTGNFRYSVIVRGLDGSWHSAGTFRMKGYETTVTIWLEERLTIDAVAVTCGKNDAHVAYSFDLTVTDPIEGGSPAAAPETEENHTYLSAHWGDKLSRPSGSWTYPLVLDDPLRSCEGFTLDYAIEEVTSGTLKDDCRFEVIYRTDDDKWKSAGFFTMDGHTATLEVALSQPTRVEAVAVVCGKSGDFRCTFSLGLRDPVF